MPNVTISVPDELKAEMDKLSEVSWSEICRNAISRYIAQRKNPTPNIELDLRNARLNRYAFETGYPTLSIDLKIHNKMNSEITVDRILSNAKFLAEDSRYLPVGSANDLHRRFIGPNSDGFTTIHLVLPEKRIIELQDKLKSTFDCQIRCAVIVDGFRNEYNQEVKTIIPIDRWNDLVKQISKTHQATRVDR